MVDTTTTLDNIDNAISTAADLVSAGLGDTALEWLNIADAHIDNLVGYLGAEDIETLRRTVDAVASAAFRAGVAA